MFAKIAERIQELLPGKRGHFIYTHRNVHDRFGSGLKANTEISYWSLSALKRAFPRVSFLRLQGEKQKRLDRIAPQDVVIGHVGETFERASLKTDRLIAFYPWSGHEDRSQNSFNCLPFETEKGYLEKARAIVFLTSEFNEREYVRKPRNFWFSYLAEIAPKVRIVHQPLDLSLFPRIKNDYTTSNFLYVGNDAHMKCLPDARQLVENLGKKLSVYGVGEKKLDNLDQRQVASLAAEADFFIQPGLWEAQCVSILEAAARGFIPVVSPDTGYPYDHPYLLRSGDADYNREVLGALLATSPEERKELADHLHDQLLSDPRHNKWEALTQVLVEEVNKLI